MVALLTRATSTKVFIKLRYEFSDNPTSYILYPISYILYPISYILYPISYILYPISYILYPISYILYHIFYVYPISYIYSISDNSLVAGRTHPTESSEAARHSHPHGAHGRTIWKHVHVGRSVMVHLVNRVHWASVVILCVLFVFLEERFLLLTPRDGGPRL